MSVEHTLSLKNVMLSSNIGVVDVIIRVTVESITLKTRQLDYTIDWVEFVGYQSSGLFDMMPVWKRAPPDVCDSLYWTCGDKIRGILFDLQEEKEYNEAEDNGYPHW